MPPGAEGPYLERQASLVQIRTLTSCSVSGWWPPALEQCLIRMPVYQPLMLGQDEQTSHVPTFPQTAPAYYSSCCPGVECTACWETDWSHLVCEGDW
jgi:hypothetical protein